MPDGPPPLPYRSQGDTIADDVDTMRRSMGTWIVLCTVWAVGLVVWATYLVGIAYAVFRLLL